MNEQLVFGPRKVKCDFCGHEERCAITHYGTSHYNRLICVECAMSINEHDKIWTTLPFDLNNAIIRFKEEVK